MKRAGSPPPKIPKPKKSSRSLKRLQDAVNGKDVSLPSGYSSLLIGGAKNQGSEPSEISKLPFIAQKDLEGDSLLPESKAFISQIDLNQPPCPSGIERTFTMTVKSKPPFLIAEKRKN